MKPSNVSECCGSSVSVAGSDEGTMFFVCDACHKPCDVLLSGEKPAQKAKETFNGLSQQIKDIVDEAYNANLDSEKITKAPVGASGVNTGSSKNYKSIIAWALKELGWEAPYWTHEKKILNKIIKLAEQRGYERGISERSKNTEKDQAKMVSHVRSNQHEYDEIRGKCSCGREKDSVYHIQKPKKVQKWVKDEWGERHPVYK